MALSITTLLLSVSYFGINPVSNYIIRDPGCLYYANFSVIHKGKYLDVPTLKTIFVEDHKACGMNCLSSNSCNSYNYSQEELKCTLSTHHTGVKVNDTQWTFYTTDRTHPRNRGPKCRSLKPCSAITMCVDSCESKGYTCVPLKEIAQGKTVSAINYYSDNRKPIKAVDALPYSDPAIAYSCYVSKNVANPWFLLDLESAYQMEVIRIVNEDYCPSCASRMFHMYITIGITDTDPKNNPLCVEDANQASIETVDYTCDRSIMNGRYVYVYLKRTTLLSICEIQVYILPS